MFIQRLNKQYDYHNNIYLWNKNLHNKNEDNNDDLTFQYQW